MGEAVRRLEGGGRSDRMVGEDDRCKSQFEPVKKSLTPRVMKWGGRVRKLFFKVLRRRQNSQIRYFHTFQNLVMIEE